MIPGAPVRIIAAAALLIAALTGLVIREESLRRSGAEVLLRVEAYDPRDLLTGHYAALQLSEPVKPGEPCPPGLTREPDINLPFVDDKRPAKVWIALSRRGDHYTATGASPDRARALAMGERVVRGRGFCMPAVRRVDGVEVYEHEGQTNLDLGVGRYHADQGQAESISRQLGDADQTPAYAIVSIGSDGKARLKGLVLAGKRLTLSWF